MVKGVTMENTEVLYLLEKQEDLEHWRHKQGPKFLKKMLKKSKLSTRAFARAYDVSATYISQCVNKKIPLGEDLAAVLLGEFLEEAQ